MPAVASRPALIPWSGNALEDRFQRLAARWRDETAILSNVDEMTRHPAYQQIIGMGPPAVPLILKELARESDFWFWALSAITGQDPIPDSAVGRVEAMRAAWLNWGRENGYVS